MLLCYEDLKMKDEANRQKDEVLIIVIFLKAISKIINCIVGC